MIFEKKFYEMKTVLFSMLLGRSLSDSPTQSVGIGYGTKPSSHSPQSSGRWKDHLWSSSTGIGKDGNVNNNATSHYQVPTRRYQDQAFSRPDAAQATAQFNRDLVAPKLKPTPGNEKFNPSAHKQNLRKTAL